MLKVNLQTFAEAATEISTNPTAETTEEITAEVLGGTEESKKEEPKEETVPLSVMLKHKTENKELKKRLAELENSKLDSDIRAKKEKVKATFIEKGYNEDFASILADELTNIREEIKSIRAPQITAYDDDIEDLARNELTSDAKAYKDQIIQKMKELNTKGVDLDAETAYWLVRPKGARIKELIEDREQKAALKRQETESKVTPHSDPSKPSNPYPLDENDKKALKTLQKVQPDSGWNEEKYFKLMKQ